MKKDYAFIAILDFQEDGISIIFPDIPEAISCAKNVQEADKNAKEVLQLCLESRIRDGEIIPKPSRFKDINISSNQKLLKVKCN